MYFITALVCTIISAILLYFNRNKKGLHLNILTITFGSATLMWLIDCIFNAVNGEKFISFNDPVDGWISLWTIIGGIGFWLVLSFILNNNKETTN